MKLSEISNLEQLAVEKRRLSSQVESRERRLEHSFEKAREHTKKKFSITSILKNSVSSLFSWDMFIAHPATYFKIGATIGKKIFKKRILKK